MKSWHLPIVMIFLLCGAMSLKNANAAEKGHPARLDIHILVDASIHGSRSSKEECYGIIHELLDRVSVSSGSGRVGLFHLTNDTKEVFKISDHVNRECLLKTLSSIRQSMLNSVEGRVHAFQKAIKIAIRRARLEAKSLLLAIISERNKELNTYLKVHKLEVQVSFNGVFVINLSPAEKTPVMSSERQDLNKNLSEDIVKFLEGLSLPTTSFTDCKEEGKKVIDECRRRCVCRSGKKRECTRIRKEFTSMSTHERERYISTYKKLTTIEPYRSRYDRFIYMHYKYFCWGVHKKRLFFPWHRWYIVTMENLLREVDCRVTLPYWDWSYYGSDPWNASFNSLWSDGNEGIGRNGSIKNGFCVMSGPFKRGEWRPPYFNDPLFIIKETIRLDGLKVGIDDVVPDLANCMRRAMFGVLPSMENVLTAIRLFPPEAFTEFELYVRHNYHDRIHNQMGGTMCTHFAASSPEFFFHHAFLDKIWFLWQKQSYKHKNVFFKNKVTKMIGSKYAPYEFIDSLNMPNCIKVTYTKFPTTARAIKEKRSFDVEEDYIDDNNRVDSAYWKGVLHSYMNNGYPKCDYDSKERAHAVALFYFVNDEAKKRRKNFQSNGYQINNGQ